MIGLSTLRLSGLQLSPQQWAAILKEIPSSSLQSLSLRMIGLSSLPASLRTSPPSPLTSGRHSCLLLHPLPRFGRCRSVRWTSPACTPVFSSLLLTTSSTWTSLTAVFLPTFSSPLSPHYPLQASDLWAWLDKISGRWGETVLP